MPERKQQNAFIAHISPIRQHEKVNRCLTLLITQVSSCCHFFKPLLNQIPLGTISSFRCRLFSTSFNYTKWLQGVAQYSYSAAQLEQVGLSAFVKGTTGEVWFFFPGEQGGCSSVPPVHSWGDTFQSQTSSHLNHKEKHFVCFILGLKSIATKSWRRCTGKGGFLNNLGLYISKVSSDDYTCNQVRSESVLFEIKCPF